MDELLEACRAGAQTAAVFAPLTRRAPSGPVRADVLGRGARAEAAAAWQSLETVAPPVHIACSWAWTQAWLDQFAAVVDHRFVIARDHDGVAGAALLTRDVVHRGPLRIRRLHVGTAGEPPGSSVWVERNALAARPGRHQQVAAVVVKAASRLRGWDVLCLPGFVAGATSPFRGTDLRWHEHHEPCWVTDLSALDDLPSLLSPATRRNLRRMTRTFGTPAVEWAQDPEDARRMLDELASHSVRRWRGGAFADARFRAFHHDLTDRLLPTGSVWLARISAGPDVLTVAYGFREGDRLVGYQTAGPRLRSPGSVGVLADVALMRAARERGARLHDPLGGDSEHKRRLATHREQLVWAQGRRGLVRWGVHGLGSAAIRAAHAGGAR